MLMSLSTSLTFLKHQSPPRTEPLRADAHARRVVVGDAHAQVVLHRRAEARPGQEADLRGAQWCQMEQPRLPRSSLMRLLLCKNAGYGVSKSLAKFPAVAYLILFFSAFGYDLDGYSLHITSCDSTYAMLCFIKLNSNS